MLHRRSLLSAITGISAGLALSGKSRRLWGAHLPGGSSHELIAVLGTGRFGGSIGKRLASLGYTVVYGSRTPEEERVRALVAHCGPNTSAASMHEAAARASIIVFAMPWEPVQELLPTLGPLAGKILVDPMIAKPVIIEGYPFPSHPAQSTAEQLQGWAPGAQVVKAFISISYSTLADPTRADGPISVPYAAAPGNAKDRIARLIAELGLQPVDSGPLVCATHLENLLWFEVACNRSSKGLYELSLRKMPPPERVTTS